MDFTYLGKSGLRVSRICLGTMDFGGGMDEATARQVVDAAREAQVNFIDTADAVYFLSENHKFDIVVYFFHFLSPPRFEIKIK